MFIFHNEYKSTIKQTKQSGFSGFSCFCFYKKEKVLRFIPSDPVIPFLAIYPKEVILKQKKSIQRMLTAALTEKTKNKDKSKCK